MKRYFYRYIIGLILLISALIPFKISAQVTLVADSITMTPPGYADEVYYSMANGFVKSAPRNTWDIAFRTSKMSSGILINDGAGVVLWCYGKADTSGWATVDTSGRSGWATLYNDPDDWENGAFSRHATGHPDYGWGKYNSVTHDITGDSIFIISLRDGTFRKIWIIKKRSVDDIYIFKYANIDGSNEQQISLDLNPFIDRDFYGYSLETNSGVDFQPAKTNWDILFTKYMSVQPDGTPYPVTGVLSNDGVKTKEFHHTPLDYNQWWVNSWDSLRSTIGYDWKIFDMNTFTYKVEDSLVYFVRSLQGDVYKLIFTKFEGSSTGVVVFMKAKISSLGINNQNPSAYRISVYPNPANDFINIYQELKAEDAVIILSDIAGKILYHGVLTEGQNKISLDATGLTAGIYFLTVRTASGTSVKKIIIAR